MPKARKPKKKTTNPAMQVAATRTAPPAPAQTKATSRRKKTGAAQGQSTESGTTGPTSEVPGVNVEELQAKIAALTENLAATEKKLEKKKKKKKMIPEPTASKRKTQDEGGLCGDMGLYSTPKGRILYGDIQREVHECCRLAHIDFTRTFKQQDPESLVTFYKLLKEKFELLRRHQHDWAARDLLKQYINNKRKYKTRKDKKNADRLAASDESASTSASAHQHASGGRRGIDDIVADEEEESQEEQDESDEAGSNGGVDDEQESQSAESTFDSDD